jgi:hypothetical protein
MKKIILLYTYLKKVMKRAKNLKITPTTHEMLKKYCEDNGLKMFAFVEKLIKEKCMKPKDMYGE